MAKINPIEIPQALILVRGSLETLPTMGKIINNDENNNDSSDNKNDKIITILMIIMM